MIIIHSIGDFLFDLFPKWKEAGKDEKILIEELKEYYSYGPFVPKVSIDGDIVKIEIDTPAIFNQESDYRKAISLCERRKYAEAKKILDKLIEKDPTNSEYHRILGQLLSDEGNEEEAINSLIDSLKWNAKNYAALIMMGNIHARFKDDHETALRYYDEAIKINPNDSVAINNIGANLMQQGKFEEGKKYIEKALSINPDYPNSHYGLAMIADHEGDLQSALYSAIQAIKTNNAKDKLYEYCLALAFEEAQKIILQGNGKNIVKEYLHKLEFEVGGGGTEIELIEDDNIPTTAKLEIAENHNRTKHIVRYKSNWLGFEHLQMHELVHLDFIQQARKVDLNKLYITTNDQKAKFIMSLEPLMKKLNKQGYTAESLATYCNELFNGLNRQIFNVPIDLFIEDFLYNEYPELRAYQFMSLFALLREGIEAVTDKKILELAPKNVLSISKTYNIIYAMQFKHLFGIDCVKDYKATPDELKKAKEMYDEFTEWSYERKPGEEYELINFWAEDLGVQEYFELVDENEFRKKKPATDIDSLLDAMENDPFDIKTKDPQKEKDMEAFMKSHQQIGVNMAVAMFMVDALQLFEKMPIKKIKEIAFQIAMIGTQGIRPDTDNYRVPLIPNKTFSGYHLLAYYYVSFKLAIPEMLADIKLPFDKEYDIAQSFIKK